MNEVTEHALCYARYGWHLAPVREGKHAGSVLGRGWQLKTSRDEQKLRRWFARYDVLAVHLGPISGLIDVEADSERGVIEAQTTLGDIHTPKFSSRRGVHRLFRYVPAFQDCSKIKVVLEEMECRIGGTQPDGRPKGCISVLPPSPNREWIVPPWECDLADPPDWLVQRLVEKTRTVGRGPSIRPDYITDEHCQRSALEFVRMTPPAIEGEDGDRTTYLVAHALVSGYGLDSREALRLLLLYNRRCQPPWRREHLEHKVRSAIEYVEQQGGASYWNAVQDFSLTLSRPVSGAPLPLGVIRQEMSRARESLAPGDIVLDRALTGIGKSTQDFLEFVRRVRELMSAGGKVVMVLPDHSNCAEAVERMREEFGLQAMAWPPMDRRTCRRAAEVEQIKPSGFPPASILCPRCEFAKGCLYREEAKELKRAEASVTTHRRFALQTDEVCQGRAYIAIHEDARELLAPLYSISVGDLEEVIRELERVRPRFEEIEHNWPEGLPVTDAMIDLALDMRKELLGAESTRLFTELPHPYEEVPGKWIRAVWGLCPGISGEAVRALAELLQQNYVRGAWAVSRGQHGDVRRLVVVQRTRLPERKVYIFGDATGRLDVLQNLIDERVRDITPPGRPEQRQSILQIARNVTKGSELAEPLTQHVVARLPHVRRIGLITFRETVQRLFQGRHRLSESVQKRFSKVAYFGEGPDRASNDWVERCDLLLVMGTPYVPISAVREELIRQGLTAAAEMRSPKRVTARWQGRKFDGSVALVKTKVFGDALWRAAEDSLVLAALEQAIGRSRVFLAKGISVILVTDKLVGFDVTVRLDPAPNENADRMVKLIQSEDGIGREVIEDELQLRKRRVNVLLKREMDFNPQVQKRDELYYWKEEV